MMHSRVIGFILLGLLAISCHKAPVSETGNQEMTGIWEFCLTKSGPVTNKIETFRMSLLHNDDADLLSDGSYCGYHKPQGWLYPCAADDETGLALDNLGNKVAWDADGWFEKIDKDSRHALRASAAHGHTLAISSPAVRMEKFKLNGTEDTWHWGFHLERHTELFISEPIHNLDVDGTRLDGHYVFTVVDKEDSNGDGDIYDGTMYDRRAKVTVKVACGALSNAYLYSVHFRNVMSTAYYMPKSKTYENHVMDGGYADPLSQYYTTNTYETLGTSGTQIVGDKLVVPGEDKAIHLFQRPDQNVAFTAADEWDKASNAGKIVTAIPDFPIFSLDYSTLDGDQYRYKNLIPEIIVYSGKTGNIKSTVSLPADLEPMKEYTVIIYLSTASVEAELYVEDWDVEGSIDVDFGKVQELSAKSIYVDNWDTNPDHPAQDGTITNP